MLMYFSNKSLLRADGPAELSLSDFEALSISLALWPSSLSVKHHLHIT